MGRWLAHVPLLLLLSTLAGCQGNNRPGGPPATPAAGTPSAAPLAQRASPSPAPATGAWHDAGPMAVARDYHMATPLPNGQVLIAGGEVLGPSSQASAELYDPVARTFRPTGSMTVWRSGHTATLLPSGLVLVTGGGSEFARPTPGAKGAEAEATAELYDPRTGTWAPTTSMHAPRGEHTATLLPDGRVLVAGGTPWPQGPPEADFAELYDPVSRTWSLTGKMLTGDRRAHGATLLPDGLVLLVGGVHGFDTSLRSTELYDPATNSWQSGASARVTHVYSAVLLSTGKVLAAGSPGDTLNPAAPVGAEVYDPTTDSWAPTGPMHEPTRGSYTATLLPDGRVLVVGGGRAGSAELYDPVTNRWAPSWWSEGEPIALYTACLRLPRRSTRRRPAGGAAPVSAAGGRSSSLRRTASCQRLQMRPTLVALLVLAVALLTGCTARSSTPPPSTAAGSGAEQPSPVSQHLAASPAAGSPLPAGPTFVAQWLAVARTPSALYPQPPSDGPSYDVLAAGSRVPVLGRTDGRLAGALCAVVFDAVSYGGWHYAVFRWVRCDTLDFSQGTLATVPVIARDATSFQAEATPMVYSDTDVIHFLQKCKVMSYLTTHHTGNKINLIDGTIGYIPDPGTGVPGPKVNEIGELLKSNPQRCGFVVGQVVE